jgi:DNA-binding transcriptional regulator GbsR (MarR family)
MNERKIDINNINTRQIYKNIKGNERINILTELKNYLNMMTDKTNDVYKYTDTLIKHIESNKILDKKKLEVYIE